MRKNDYLNTAFKERKLLNTLIQCISRGDKGESVLITGGEW